MTDDNRYDDIVILERLKRLLYDTIVGEPEPETDEIAKLNPKHIPKVGELLKVIEMKKKLAIEGKAEKKFWERLNQIRTEELTKKPRSGKRKSTVPK